MLSKSGYNNGATSVAAAGNAPPPPRVPHSRMLAPVAMLDTNQVRGISRGALRPLPASLGTSHHGAMQDTGTSLARTYSGSSSVAVHPQAFSSISANRAPSATRRLQDLQAAVGTDQRAPASAYSSPHNTAMSHYYSTGSRGTGASSNAAL
jgi:hypothetical protein